VKNRTFVLLALAAVIAPLAALPSGPAPSAQEMELGIVPPARFGGLQYNMVGPSRGGRVTAVAGHRAQPGTFYMGATGGGLWKTTDYGQNWRPISDGFFATGSIGAIAVAESDPDIVYVATGSDGLRSNVIIGKGVYKSTDAGQTWAHIGLENTGNSGAVLIHPENPDLAYVAAIGNPFAPNPERGVYRTQDGGSSWELVLHVSDKTGAVDLEFAPDDPRRVYATMWEAERKPWTILSGGMEGGVFRSTNGGDSWQQLTDGLPTGLRGKADLAVSAGDPDRVYVLIEAPEDQGGVYRSDDRGDSWSQVTDFQPIRNRPFYYTNLHAHPVDPDTIWGMAEGFYESTDGGENWQSRRVPHGDNHDLWINPDNPMVWVQANDGGANVSRDGGATWSTQSNQPTAELYQVDISDEYPYRLFAGQQDNSTISVPSRALSGRPGGPAAYWESHGGCETGPAVPKPGDPDIVYANCKGRFGFYNRRTGQEQQNYVGYWNIYGRNPKDLAYRFQRVSPIAVSPHSPVRVYHGSQYVHMTEDGGLTWQTISPDLTAFDPETQVVSGSPITLDVTGEEHFSTLYDVQESPHEPGVIWAGANDGPIHVTRDGGANWANVTPPGIGPHGRVQNIEVSPYHAGTAYATIMRYQVGDFAPYAFKTTDYGDNWTLLTTGDNGIPGDHPVRVVREDPKREGLLYAGTEFGMFVSFDDGANWQSLQLNLPATPVSDIKVVGDDLVLSTMGRGFWILYDVSPIRDADNIAGLVHLYPISDAVRTRGRGFFFRAPGPADPQYPAGGANIDYFLEAAPSAAINLEIRAADGELVRAFSSEDIGQVIEDAEPGMRERQLAAIGTPNLPSVAGMHRFTWDLRYAGPWDSNARRLGQGGPLVPPGTYTATLMIDEMRLSHEFEVMMDPRVAAEGIGVADVTAQAEFTKRVRDAYSAAQHAVADLGAISEANGGALPDALQSVHDAMVTTGPRYSPPMLLDQLQYLYFNIQSADQFPSDFMRARLDELAAELHGYLQTIAANTTD